jgi:hypothetical protein
MDPINDEAKESAFIENSPILDVLSRSSLPLRSTPLIRESDGVDTVTDRVDDKLSADRLLPSGDEKSTHKRSLSDRLNVSNLTINTNPNDSRIQSTSFIPYRVDGGHLSPTRTRERSATTDSMQNSTQIVGDLTSQKSLSKDELDTRHGRSLSVEHMNSFTGRAPLHSLSLSRPLTPNLVTVTYSVSLHMVFIMYYYTCTSSSPARQEPLSNPLHCSPFNSLHGL